MATILLLLFFHLSVRAYLRSYTRSSVMMPDGRYWTNVNLNFPILGYRYPGAPKIEGRLYKFRHVQIINFLLEFFLVGWHIPTDKEWQQMLDAVGEYVGFTLKSKECFGSDEFRFNVLLSGYYDGDDDDYKFNARRLFAYFWSSSAVKGSRAWRRSLNPLDSCVYRRDASRSFGHSVRLIKNAHRNF